MASGVSQRLGALRVAGESGWGGVDYDDVNARMAPDNRAELKENLTILSDWRGLTDEEWTTLSEHGKRVYKHAGSFP